MTKVTSITPRVYVDEDGVPFFATAEGGVQVWDVEFNDAPPMGAVGKTAAEAEASALAYLAG